MQDYEKLGVFYLGRRWDPGRGAATDEPVLYDSRDLCTHAVIIGMTGSGKTGLGIAMIEEAALDRVPVIAIDPKGDLGNLLLTFPELRPADFEPWVDPQAAATAGQSVPDYAATEAERWRSGLARAGQNPERIARLRAAADFALYTPGSTAGRPLAVLGGFAAPPEALRTDADLYRQHLQGTVDGLLALAGIATGPVDGREQVLLAAVLDNHWQQGRSLDLPGLIGAIQNPGVAQVGVLDLETFYPAKERFALAMRLNNLLAAPGFQAWLTGEPLDAGALLFTPDGRPRVSVLSIAHLDDAERMFFVTLLLNSLIAWMRAQPGTASLRAILYMDEVFGFLPPVAAPPSKLLLLTLLKQARAFGLGVVLSTQNPVDLDYKALSNAGTWLIGRLQTEQDRNRVRDGLRSAAGAGNLASADLDATLGSLAKRTFLLHNVHDSAPVLLETRWAMAYLRGPMSREDIRRITASALPAPAVKAPAPASATAPDASSGGTDQRPVLPPAIPEAFGVAPPPAAGGRRIYLPRLVGTARVAYASVRHGVDLRRDLALALEPGGGALDWRDAAPLALDPAALVPQPEPGAQFGPLPKALADPRAVKAAIGAFRSWLRTEQPLVLQRSPRFKVTSAPGESEGAFRARLQQLGREERDAAAEKLRRAHAARFASLRDRLQRARQAVERESDQATGSRVEAAVSVGTAVLGALFGRKPFSARTAGRVSTAVRKAGDAQRQSGDVTRASETVATLQAQLDELEARVQAEVAGLAAGYDAQAEPLETIRLQPRAADVVVQFCGIGWLPFTEDGQGNLRPA